MLSTLSGRSEDKYLLPLPAIEPQFIGRPADSLITMPVFPKQNYVEPSGLAERRFGFPCKLWKFRGTFGTRRRSFWVPIQIVEIPWNLRDSQNVVLGSDANCGNRKFLKTKIPRNITKYRSKYRGICKKKTTRPSHTQVRRLSRGKF